MWNPLNLWRGPSRPQPPKQALKPQAPPTRPMPLDAGDDPPRSGDRLPQPDAALDDRFSAMLLSLGGLRLGQMAPAEQTVLPWIEELAHGPARRDLLPRLPAVLPKLMSLARRDDVSPREITEHLAQDPALVAEVIRIASSPRYRASRTLSSLQDAVMVLGQRGLLQLVTNVAMQPVFNAQQGRFSQVARSHLWAQSSRCAHACAYLRDARVDPFEAYLGGMVVNAGLIPALWVLDQRYTGPHLPDTAAFHEQLRRLGLLISASIAKAWHFPEGIGQAIEALTTEQATEVPSRLAILLRSADQVSKRHLLGLAPARPLGSGDAEADTDPCFVELDRVFGPERALA